MRSVCIVGLLLVLALGTSELSAAPLVGASAQTLPEGAFMVDGWFLWRDLTWRFENSSDAWSTLPSDYSLTAGTFVPRVYYGLSEWLTLRAGIAIEDRYRDIPDLDDSRASTGLGDFVFDPKIRVYEGDDGYPQLAVLMGVRVPTGETEADIPLSDGSTDILLGAAATQRSGDSCGHVCVTHWFNGEDTQGFDIKDLWIATLTLETPFDEGWSLLWEVKGYAGSESGSYRRLYVCPGISWSVGRATVGFSAMVSAYRRGDTATNPYDFDWAPYVRVYYRFF